MVISYKNNISVKIVSDGTWQMDGGTLFGPVKKTYWEQYLNPDRRNRVRMGLNSLLVMSAEGNVLVNTGMGNHDPEQNREEYGHTSSKLLRQLQLNGVNARGISHVVLTHLHFDHSGGATRNDTQNKTVPTFPKARYLIQKKDWEEANNLNEKTAIAYGNGIEHLNVLADRDMIDFVDGDVEVLPGINLKMTGGPSAGHSIVEVNAGSERYMYLSDLVPTPAHLYGPCISSYDRYPEQTFEQKKQVLQRALDDGWLLIFAHGYKEQGGYLTRDGFRPITL